MVRCLYPNAYQPGSVSEELRRDLDNCGYPLAVNNQGGLIAPAAIEVYPHPALLCLLELDYRLPYKVSKSRRYWPGTPRGERVDSLLVRFRQIYAGLAGEIEGICDFLPEHPESLNFLKRYEDALDALVCAWVGARYLDGHAVAYGDHNAAIWVPECRANPLPEG